MGENIHLSLKNLTVKMAMLLALTRPSPSADLHGLDIRLLPEGAFFQAAEPAKTTNVGRSAKVSFSPILSK